MNLQRFLILLLFLVGTHLLPGAEESLPVDRIEVEGGVVLTGIIESVDAAFMTLSTDYAGSLVVDMSKVRQVTTNRHLTFEFPENVVVIGSPSGSAQPSPEPAEVASKEVKAPAKPRTNPEPAWGTPENKRGWDLDAGLDFNSRSGNTEKLDLTVTLDAKLQRQFDRVDLYSRYSYGKNKGNVSANEFVTGGRYTNFFYRDLGFFVRQELELDEFEGLVYRSTTASGVTWKVRNRDDLRIEARSGLSYRYEDYKDDGYDQFPGMDFGLDVNWKITQWVRFKGSYTFLPSVVEADDYIVEQDSGIDMPLDMSDRWKLRLGMSAKYNNSPELGRERLDTRYYARVIASWP